MQPYEHLSGLYIVATNLPLTLGWLSSSTRGGSPKKDVYDFPKFRDGVLSKFVPCMKEGLHKLLQTCSNNHVYLIQ